MRVMRIHSQPLNPGETCKVKYVFCVLLERAQLFIACDSHYSTGITPTLDSIRWRQVSGESGNHKAISLIIHI